MEDPILLRTRLGDRVRDLRRRRGLSLRELAWAVSCSASALSYVENGRNYPSFDLLVRIAETLDTSVDALLKAEDSLAGSESAWMVDASAFRIFALAPGERRTYGEPAAPGMIGILFVLEGTIVIRFAGHATTLTAGSSLQFDPSREQEFVNPLDQPATMLWGRLELPMAKRSRAAS